MRVNLSVDVLADANSHSIRIHSTRLVSQMNKTIATADADASTIFLHSDVPSNI